MPLSEKRGALLVGSGISIPAGYPSVQNLTAIVLAGNGAFKKHTDGTYYTNTSDQEICPYVGAATAMLRRIKQEIDPYLCQYQYCGREANYEDLAYVLRQLGDFALGEIENPVVDPFLKQIIPATASREAVNGHYDSIGSQMRQAEDYVCDVVWRSLDREADSCQHLDLFLAAIKEKSARDVAIGTLNHDTHFERYLVKSGLQIWDGFGQEENEVRYWSNSGINQDEEGVPFFKLHGSIDWFRIRPPDGMAFYDDRIGLPLTNDLWHTRTIDGRLQTLLDGRPLMLVGTFNKYIDYTSELFPTIHCRWRERLNASDRLVICGYGFGDRGINAQIIEWVYGSRDRKILIINPHIEELKNRCRGAIRNKWDEWVEWGVLEVVDAQVQCADPDLVAKFLSS